MIPYLYKDLMALFCSMLELVVELNFFGKYHPGVVVITTAQLLSAKSEFRFCTCSNSVCGMSEIYFESGGENL